MTRGHAIAAALVAAALGLTLAVLLTADDAPDTRSSFNVPPGDLALALLRLAEPFPDADQAIPLKEGEHELCDYGRVNLRNGFTLPTTIKADARLALERAANDLMARGNDADRAFGLKLRAAAAASGVPWSEYLAQLALTTNDASAYARAFHACEKPDVATYARSCALVSAERWAQLDPHNAAPWLYVAQKAQQRKDDSALENAVYRIAAARTSDVRWGADYLLMQSRSVQEQPRYTQAALMIELIGMTAGFPMTHLSTLSTFCGREQMINGNRRQLCRDVATTLIEKDTTSMGVMAGIGIAERAGAPTELIARLRDELDAVQATDLFLTLNESLLGCTWFEKTRSRLEDIARRGEVASARASINAGGHSMSELAQQYRQWNAQVAEQIKSSQATGDGLQPPVALAPN